MHTVSIHSLQLAETRKKALPYTYSTKIDSFHLLQDNPGTSLTWTLMVACRVLFDISIYHLLSLTELLSLWINQLLIIGFPLSSIVIFSFRVFSNTPCLCKHSPSCMQFPQISFSLSIILFSRSSITFPYIYFLIFPANQVKCVPYCLYLFHPMI